MVSTSKRVHGAELDTLDLTEHERMCRCSAAGSGILKASRAPRQGKFMQSRRATQLGKSSGQLPK